MIHPPIIEYNQFIVPPHKYNKMTKVANDFNTLCDQLFEIIIEKPMENIGNIDDEEIDELITKNTLIWADIKLKILTLSCGSFYLGLGNELLPPGTRSVNDLIKDIRKLDLATETISDVVRTLETSGCFKLNKENDNGK